MGKMEKQYTAKDYLVVMPSIRKINPDYLAALRGFDIFVCDDSDGKVDRTYILDEKYKDDGFKRMILGNHDFRMSYIPKGKEHLFPRHCPSVKDLGLYYAWKEGYKAVILIDDDVDTRTVTFEAFMTIKKPTPVVGFHTQSGWFNTLALLEKHPYFYARGYPYEYRAEELMWGDSGNVIPYFNEGLWIGTPDINGIDKLESGDLETLFESESDTNQPWYIPPVHINSQVHIAPKQKLPLSIMNCQIDTSLIPAFWQPPDYQLYRTFKVRRHDDVWSMYLLKTVMDIHNLSVTVGHPVCWHRKAGDPIREVLSEHHTNLIQSRLTSLVDDNREHTINGDIAATTASLASLCRDDMRYGQQNNFEVILDSYFDCAVQWAEMFMV